MVLVKTIRPKPLPQYLWHHDLHRKWSGERLYYWRIGFRNNALDAGLALEQVEVAMHTSQVPSYALYELYGDIDLLLKVWLPSSVDVPAFREALGGALTKPHNAYVDNFSVEQIIYHWLWPDSVNVDLARSTISISDVGRLNHGERVSSKKLRQYTDSNYIAKVRASASIKFFMYIPRSDYLRTDLDEQRFHRMIISTLRDSKVVHSALYRGDGFANYLITGRVLPHGFEAISELAGEINSYGANKHMDASTFTYVSSRAMPLDREELLLPAELQDQQLLSRDEPGDLESLIVSGESRVLEFKGSVFLDVAQAVRTSSPLKSSKTMPDAIVKTVTALLNGAGGKLILGVFESAELSKQELLQVVGVDPVTLGVYECVGIDYEYGGKGWEEYERRLHQLIRRSIEPSPEGWYSITRVSYRDHDYALVSVRRGAGWFFAKVKTNAGIVKVFYGRRAAASEPLEGIEMEAYRQANPRSSRNSN